MVNKKEKIEIKSIIDDLQKCYELLSSEKMIIERVDKNAYWCFKDKEYKDYTFETLNRENQIILMEEISRNTIRLYSILYGELMSKETYEQRDIRRYPSLYKKGKRIMIERLKE